MATLESGLREVAFISGTICTLGARQASGSAAKPMKFDHAGHRAMLKDFNAAAQSVVGGRSALGVRQMIEAIMAASNTGVAVSLNPAARIPLSQGQAGPPFPHIFSRQSTCSGR